MGSFETRRSYARALFSPLLLVHARVRCWSIQPEKMRSVEKRRIFLSVTAASRIHARARRFFSLTHFRCNFNLRKFERSNNTRIIVGFVSPVSCERHRCGITDGYTYQRDPPIRSMVNKQLPPCLVPSINRSLRFVAPEREREIERLPSLLALMTALHEPICLCLSNYARRIIYAILCYRFYCRG